MLEFNLCPFHREYLDTVGGDPEKVKLSVGLNFCEADRASHF